MDNEKSTLPSVLTEKDFYPPKDTRTLRSNLCSVVCDEFSTFLLEFFELCDEEEVYDEKILF